MAAKYSQVVYVGASDSGTIGASSTATVNFDTHNYAIPANDLVAGVSYEVEGIAQIGWVIDYPEWREAGPGHPEMPRRIVARRTGADASVRVVVDAWRLEREARVQTPSP